MECRLPGADVNPYLALSAMIAAGLHGIDESSSSSPPFEGNAYESDKPRVPGTLRDARDAFAASDGGARRVRRGRRRPLPQQRPRRARGVRAAVTDWERVRGFERL